MAKKIRIGERELVLMKALWEKGPCTSPELFAGMDDNVSTLKTMLKRLVDKGAVKAEEYIPRNYLYSAVLTEDEYIRNARKSFLQTVFDGSKEKMLLNFVKEEHVTKEELQNLLDLIEEDS